jgi:hypothetical protein
MYLVLTTQEQPIKKLSPINESCFTGKPKVNKKTLIKQNIIEYQLISVFEVLFLEMYTIPSAKVMMLSLSANKTNDQHNALTKNRPKKKPEQQENKQMKNNNKVNCSVTCIYLPLI